MGHKTDKPYSHYDYMAFSSQNATMRVKLVTWIKSVIATIGMIVSIIKRG